VDTQTDVTKLVHASLQLNVATAPKESQGRMQCVWVCTVLQDYTFTLLHVQQHKVLTFRHNLLLLDFVFVALIIAEMV
jgi:hypothetical protein